MTTTKQRTRTDFLCLTISAGEGKRDDSSPAGPHYTYNVSVQSDATNVTRRFTYHDSIHNASKGIDQLDRKGLLFAFWSFVQDADAGGMNFKEFCGDYGYNEDSMSAHQTWKACQDAAKKFRALWHDEREPVWVLEQLATIGIE